MTGTTVRIVAHSKKVMYRNGRLRSLESRPSHLLHPRFTSATSIRSFITALRDSPTISSSSTRPLWANQASLRRWSSAASSLHDLSPGASSSSILSQNDPDIPADLLLLASQQPTPLRLADMYKYGNSTDSDQRLRNAQFLHRELPIRIAQRAVDLLTLPYKLNTAAPVQQVVNMYLEYLNDLRNMPVPSTVPEEAAFTDLLQSFVLDRAAVPMAVAQGITAWSEDQKRQNNNTGTKRTNERLQEIEDALYRFFTARVGLRFLTEHHVLSSDLESSRALRKSTFLFGQDKAEYRGCIQTNVDVYAETQLVADLVIKQTQEFYGMCPEITILDCAENKSRDFTYVPHHLHYMLAELLKNSCRAVVERYIRNEYLKKKGDIGIKAELFPIRVVIVKGVEDVTIKIADKGGGIPRSLMNSIWKFGHSERQQDDTDDGDDSKIASFRTDDVAGARIRGFGLPLARIYARYFGGELSLKSMEGYGVDAYLHFPRLGVCCENLPLRVRASPGELDSMPSRH